jgi:hypothetical protein
LDPKIIIYSKSSKIIKEKAFYSENCSILEYMESEASIAASGHFQSQRTGNIMINGFVKCAKKYDYEVNNLKDESYDNISI